MKAVCGLERQSETSGSQRQWRSMSSCIISPWTLPVLTEKTGGKKPLRSTHKAQTWARIKQLCWMEKKPIQTWFRLLIQPSLTHYWTKPILFRNEWQLIAATLRALVKTHHKLELKIKEKKKTNKQKINRLLPTEYTLMVARSELGKG